MNTNTRSFNVYVINLDPAVMDDSRFKAANPDWEPGKPCVYVGSTAHSPEHRFQQHRQGYKANRFARDHGTGLRMQPAEDLQGLQTRDQAEEEERRLARRLRKEGYAVWQG